MLTGLYNILRGTVVLLGLVAFGSFVWVYNEQVKTEKARLAVETTRQADADREVFIYQALVNAGADGLDLAAIQQDAIETDTLRALLDLTAKGAVRVLADGRYGLVMTSPDRENPFERSAQLAEAIIAHVAANPDGYTVAELKDWLMNEHQLTRLEAASALRPLIPASMANVPVLAPANVLQPALLPEQKLVVVE